MRSVRRQSSADLFCRKPLSASVLRANRRQSAGKNDIKTPQSSSTRSFSSMGAHLYQRRDNITTKQVSAYGVHPGLARKTCLALKGLQARECHSCDRKTILA